MLYSVAYRILGVLHIDKTYSCLQAEETASDGRLITFMDGGIGEKPPRGKPWEGAGKKNKEKRDRGPSMDPILISVLVHGRQVGRVLLDRGAACDVIYEHCFLKLQKEIRERKREVYTTLFGFTGEQVSPLGEITMKIIIGEAPHYRSEQIAFLIVRPDSPNNALFERTAIAELGKIPSTMHSAVLYQSEAGPRVIISEYQDIRRWIPRTLKVRDKIFVTKHMLNEKKKSRMYNQRRQRTKKGMNNKRDKMVKEDEHKTDFHTLKGVYCYKKMPFGLKNARATYQRLVDKVFESQIGRNMEAYVDDLVIKSMEETDMIADIQETFERL
nr:retrotransposon protein, putative, Ty3-gypsy subclass [Tanacetum cinerariifolium]